MTPLGEVAIYANSLEFLAIWEHQKIKMISQPIYSEFCKKNDNMSANLNYDRFSINFSPYVDLMRFISTNNGVTFEEYQYIVSRNKLNCFVNFMENNELKILIENIESIKEVIKNFGRNGDIQPEDFDKELKKYILGIRSDLNLDLNKNPLSLLSYNKKHNKNITITNPEKFNNTLMVYNKLNDYKLNKYKDLLNSCNEESKKCIRIQIIVWIL